MRKIPFLLLFVLIATSRVAWGRLGFSGLQNQSYLSSGGSVSDPSPHYGYALSWELPVQNNFGWELGFLSYTRKWNLSSEVPVYTVPLVHNYWPSRYFGLGAGAYFTKSHDPWRVSSVQSTQENSGFRSYDFGVLGSLKINLPFEIKGLHLHLEARYHYGTANVSSLEAQIARFSDLQFAVGIKLGNIFEAARKEKDSER